MRRHRSQSSWGRMTRCRGALDDCYSSTTRHYGDNQHHSGYRSRDYVQKNATWRPKTASKRVSFADPVATFFGAPSKEQRIQHMLENATSWAYVDSPRGTDNMGGAALNLQIAHANHGQKLPRPFNKHTMEALQALVEEGNKPRSKKKSKVAPSPATATATA